MPIWRDKLVPALHRRRSISSPRHDEFEIESSQTLIDRSRADDTTTQPFRGKVSDLWQTITACFCSASTRNDLPFKASTRPSCYVVLLHLTPVLGVTMITFFNLYGYWVGKELSGLNNNQNTPKQLALQLTAKLHELLMLASLAELLLTHLLKSLATGHGLPFGSLTAANRFKSLAYLGSRDFRAMFVTKYSRKVILVPLILLCTCLSFTVGPSSATALIPRLETWPAGKAIMTLDASTDHLWSSHLEVETSDILPCDESALGCKNSLSWDSIAANFFSFWDQNIDRGPAALPQRINIPSALSLRSMEIRPRNSTGPSRPDSTIASVQHAVIGDMVNKFRFLTFPSRSAKCNTSWSPAMCSYQDASWVADAMQPLVLTVCSQPESVLSLLKWPMADSDSNPLNVTNARLNSSADPQEIFPFSWVTPDKIPSSNASIGVVINLGTATSAAYYACLVQARWTRSTTSVTYSGTGNLVSNSPLDFDQLSIVGSDKRDQLVRISPDWAQQAVNSVADSQQNTTAFDRFWRLGSTQNLSVVKLEAILSIIVAEKMAHVGSGVEALAITSTDLFLKRSGSLTKRDLTSLQKKASANSTEFVLRTTMKGYGYGLYTTSGLSSSVLISIIVLLVYSLTIIVHLIVLFTSKEPYIESWREERDMLVTCLQSRFEPSVRQLRDDGTQHYGRRSADQDEEVGLLKDIVLVTSRRGWPELSFRTEVWLDRD